MRETIKRIPLLGPLIRKTYRVFKPIKPFTNSASYWEDRYESGGTSGVGSFGKLAQYKATFINDFVKKHEVRTIIEHGCGDGNQLKLAEYNNYLGFDVSSKAVALCANIFRDDKSKVFKTNAEYNGEKAELAYSFDVIFHLVEDDTFHSYMKRLFNSAEKFVIIYSSNTDNHLGPHERHREFTPFVEKNCPDWTLTEHIPNEFPFEGNNEKGSMSDFYIYQKSS